MKTKMNIIIWAVLSCLILYIISSTSFISTNVFANSTDASTIGGIEVDGLKDEEIISTLENALKNWQSEPIIVSGAGVSLQIDSATIQYDINQTIELYNAQTKKAFLAFWEKKPTVHIPLVVKPSEEVKQLISSQMFWDTESTYSNVILNASYLLNHEIEATVSNLSQIENERLAVAIREVPAEILSTQTLVDLLDEQIISAGEEFSYLATIDPLKGSQSSETLSYVASVLYEAVLKLNGQITERHQHQQLPTYISPGLDAEIVVLEQRDFRFINKFKQPIKLRASREGVNLKIEFFAALSDETASIRVSTDSSVEPRTITRYSNELPVGTKKVIQEGKKGTRVTVYQTNITTGEEQLVSRDYYAPINEIILASSRQPVELSDSSTADGATVNEGEANSGDDLGLQDEGDFKSSEEDSSEEESYSSNSSSTPKYDKGGNIIN